MTKQAGFKRRVRARMARTGESYATARSMLLADHPDTAPGTAGATAGPPPDDLSDALHLTNGDATDLPGTGLAPRVVFWRDVLHEGPVPEVPADELRRLRVGFLTRNDPAHHAAVLDEFTARDRAVKAARHGEFVLWFEADLYDQLQIVEILVRLADLGVPAERITLICIGEHAGIARFGGLGQLTADQLRELPHTPARARLTPAALDLARRAWTAFRAPTPEGLAGIAAARLPDLRFLGEAFDRLGREYPSTRDGLALTERRILAAVAEGAPDAGTAFTRAASRETRPFLGDLTCYDRIVDLASGPDPLLSVTSSPGPVRRTTAVHLTSTGTEVLAGRADRIARTGIDRWIGGVHLTGHQVPWRWDDGAEKVVRVTEDG